MKYRIFSSNVYVVYNPKLSFSCSLVIFSFSVSSVRGKDTIVWSSVIQCGFVYLACLSICLPEHRFRFVGEFSLQP